jgi:hypothetical protein
VSAERRARHVPAGLYWKARLFESTAGLWRRLARLETAVLGDELAGVDVRQPIYVAGVARSGTTLVTEMLARHPDVTSHRYSDFPNVHTPFWRNWLAARTRRPAPAAVERAHKDRLMVTPESPEAVEEVVWMQFFDHLHDPASSHVMDSDVDAPAFARHYREHVAKLLLARGASRYLAKGNYNTTRLGYLLQLFPDARIVVPVREPVQHVASLVKQDRLFTRLAEEDPRVPGQLARSGHFEFGPGKRAINAGDADLAAEIHARWSAGEAAAGWALYWESVYRHVLDFIDAHPDRAGQVLLLRYEDLCADPAATIDAVLDHCQLSAGGFDDARAEYVERISPPDYYRPGFGEADVGTIEATCGETARRLGYPESA